MFAILERIIYFCANKYLSNMIEKPPKFQNDEIGKLMHDFSCSDPDDMLNKILADRTRYYKETEEGVEVVCKAMEDMRNDTSVRTYIEACIDFGIKDKDEIIKKLLDKFKFLTKAQAERYFPQ